MKESTEQRVERSEWAVKVDSVVVAIRDTVREVTTITIRENEQGDTLRVTTITDRERARERDRARVQDVRVEVRTDTVYIAHRDSAYVETSRQARGDKARASPVVSALKWIFGIMALVIILVTILKYRRF